MNIMNPLKNEFVCIRLKIVANITRVTVTFADNSSPSIQDFSSFTTWLNEFYQTCDNSDAYFCMIFDICNLKPMTALSSISNVTDLLNKNRNILRKYSLFSCVVTTTVTRIILNAVTAIYKPTNELLVFQSMKEAKSYVTRRLKKLELNEE